MVGVEELRTRQLGDAYANDQGRSIAYIDESYLAPGAIENSQVAPFYIMTAYVLPTATASSMRDDLPDVVGATYWHSTQSHRTTDGQAKIVELAQYISEGDEPIVVCVQQPIDLDDVNGELARTNCFTRLLGTLATGTHCDPISLAIFEERKFATQKNADEKTVKQARVSGVIPRPMRVLPTSPTYEPLLWLPDVASFALYQSMSGVREDYLDPFRDRVRIVHYP